MKPIQVETVHIKGFRSLCDVEFSNIPRAAVLIGANGSGKSNFIRFFNMLSWMLGSHNLAEFISSQGGADDQLFGGSSLTQQIEAELTIRTEMGRNDYGFSLANAHPDRLLFTSERFRFTSDSGSAQLARWNNLGSAHTEAEIVNTAQSKRKNHSAAVTAKTIVTLLRRCAVYQFHDTSNNSNFKKNWDAQDTSYLRSHGGNLAPVLLRLEREDVKRYEMICRHISRVLPVFDKFELDESFGKVFLRWKPKSTGKTIGAHLTSDGSLRFFALVTLLNLPPEMLPDVLLLDEPELGLHPSAIVLIGGMIKSLAQDRQVIVATQSPLLVDAFNLDEVFVLELREGATDIRKLTPGDYKEWLEDDFRPGDLWLKNLLGGRP